MAEKLSYEAFLSTLNGLKVRSVVQTAVGWAVEAEGSPSAICPDCGATSHSRHSRYWRRLQEQRVKAQPSINAPLVVATPLLELILGGDNRRVCLRRESAQLNAAAMRPCDDSQLPSMREG